MEVSPLDGVSQGELKVDDHCRAPRSTKLHLEIDWHADLESTFEVDNEGDVLRTEAHDDAEGHSALEHGHGVSTRRQSTNSKPPLRVGRTENLGSVFSVHSADDDARPGAGRAC